MSLGFVNFGVKELILVLFIVLIIFGPKKLPEIGRSFGEMLGNFRKGTKTSEQNEDSNGETSKGEGK